MNLSDILAPLPVDEFLVNRFGVEAVHAPGDAERFALLAPERPDAGRRSALLAASLGRDLETPVSLVPDAPQGQWQCECDMLVLQVSGAEQWLLHRPGDTIEDEITVLLKAGDALYIPRGFSVRSSRHESPVAKRLFQIHNPTGAQLLQTLTEILGEMEIFRKDIPRFAGPAIRSAYLSQLRKAFAARFRSPGLLMGFLQRLNNRAVCDRSSLKDEPVLKTDWVDLATPRRPRIQRADAETIFIRVSAADYRLPAEAAELFQYVIDKAPFPAADFCRDMQPEYEESEVLDFLMTLRKDGILT